MTPILIIVLNYVIFLKFYRYQHIYVSVVFSVRVCVTALCFIGGLLNINKVRIVTLENKRWTMVWIGGPIQRL